MPQAIDLVQPAAAPRPSRQPRAAEPPSRFKDVIEQRARRPEPERPPEPKAEAPAAKSAKAVKSKSVEQSDDSSEAIEAIPEDAMPAAEGAAAEPAQTGPADDEAPVDSAADGESGSADSEAGPDAEPSEDVPVDAMLLAMSAVSASVPVQPAADTAGVAGGTDPVGIAAVADPASSVAGVTGALAATSAQSPAAGMTASANPAEAQATPEATTGAATAVLPADNANADSHADTDTDAGADLSGNGLAALDGMAADESADTTKPTSFAAIHAEALTQDSDADGALTQVQPGEARPAPVNQPLSMPAMKVAAPEEQFVERNAEGIVTTIRGELMPTGGSMKIRLDPPNMGQLQIDVTVARDGTISAAFQTSNEDAAKLLSHGIQHLKTAIETAGVAVDRIQVRQASPAEQSGSSQNNGRDQNQQPQDGSARQEQQRREMLERMWAKLTGNEDPLDLVA
jgi:flagellar hook-length control protein FliK